MSIRTIPIDRIDFSAKSFPKYAVDIMVPEDFFPYPLPLFITTGDLFLPVSAHGRLLGARRDGTDRVAGFVFEQLLPTSAFTLCLKDIAWSRAIDDADRITAIGKLGELDPGADPDEQLARVMGIEPSPGMFEQYKKIHRLGQDAIETIRAGRLSFGAALVVAQSPKQERKALLDLFSKIIRPNRNTARRITENLVAVALIQNKPVKQVIQTENLNRILKGDFSGPEKIRAFDRAIYQMRYPALSGQIKKTEAVIDEISFPSGIQVTLPAHLEGGYIDFHIRAKSLAELSSLACSISGAEKNDSLTTLFNLVTK